MSMLCFFNFDAKRLSFKKLNDLSNEIIKNALLNGFAAFFNDSFLDEIKIRENLSTTILLSDSFLYRNSDDLLDVTDFVYDTELTLKNKFIRKYDFLLQFADIIFKYDINKLDFYVLTQGYENYTFIQAQKSCATEALLDIFLSQVFKTGFTFPDLKIQIEK